MQKQGNSDKSLAGLQKQSENHESYGSGNTISWNVQTSGRPGGCLMEKFVSKWLSISVCEQVALISSNVRLTKDLHHKLLIARKNLKEHNISLRWRKVQEISNAAAVARSSIQRSARQYRAICSQPSQKILETNGHSSTVKCEAKEESEISEATPAVSSASTSRLPVSAERRKLPNVGDSVRVPSLNKQALVLKVDPSREELLVQAVRSVLGILGLVFETASQHLQLA
ncbi:hypothetical protein CQW23_08052 [Capsicum baccatum]|uniref:Uncharacterized protein n=1 Tax=Capsicum baccatum TaxID=33114 RepID=A0A2G2X7Z3_CAPBA|nr:hypothetical protein CQW23_08052 [Capsicum baccatum]